MEIITRRKNHEMLIRPIGVYIKKYGIITEEKKQADKTITASNNEQSDMGRHTIIYIYLRIRRFLHALDRGIDSVPPKLSLSIRLNNIISLSLTHVPSFIRDDLGFLNHLTDESHMNFLLVFFEALS